MAWSIEFTDQARKQLGRLGSDVQPRIAGFLRERVGSGDPRAHGMPLKGSRYQHLWRYRLGDYRIICDIQDHRLVVLVVSVGDRKDIYR